MVYPVLGFVRGQIIVNVIVVFLVLVIVGLRIISRLRVAGLGWDDGMIVFAAVSFILHKVSCSCCSQLYKASGSCNVGLPRAL